MHCVAHVHSFTTALSMTCFHATPSLTFSSLAVVVELVRKGLANAEDDIGRVLVHVLIRI